MLLARSIRRWGGRFADAPIHAFSPRLDRQPTSVTLRVLGELGVVHHTEARNTAFPDWGMGNKFAALTWAETNVDADVLAFLDSDSILTSEPEAFRLAPGIDVALRPADRKDKGSTGPGDPREPYWQRLYEICGVTERPFVETGVDGLRIRAYFNGGMVVARRSSGFLSAWQADLERLTGAGHLPPEGIGFMDMLSLAATAARVIDRVQIVDERYNYPLPLRPAMPAPFRDAQLEALVHVHYHRWFNRPGFLGALQPPLDPESPIVRWLEPWLPFEPTIGGLPQAIKAMLPRDERRRQLGWGKRPARTLWDRFMARRNG